MFSRRLPVPGAQDAVRALFAGGVRDGQVLDLTVSNPTRVGLGYPAPELRQALAVEGVAHYRADGKGLVSARACIAADWQARGYPTNCEDVILTASTSEAYALLFKLLCDPGDEVLVPEPSYPLFEVLTRLEGVEPRSYRLAYDGAWHLDLASLTAQRSPRTKAVIAVSPNNPTGNFLKTEELRALKDLGLPLIVDEVFWPYAWNPAAAVAESALGTPDSLVFVLDGLSKRCGLPQLKLGWITLGGPSSVKAEARTRLELVNDSYLSASTPTQLALPRLLELGQGIQRQIRDRCQVNLASLTTSLEGSAVSALHLEGGWSACLRLPALLSDDDWMLSLLHDRDLLVQPGWLYDLGPSPHLVLSLLPKPEVFARALERLVEHVAARL